MAHNPDRPSFEGDKESEFQPTPPVRADSLRVVSDLSTPSVSEMFPFIKSGVLLTDGFMFPIYGTTGNGKKRILTIDASFEIISQEILSSDSSEEVVVARATHERAVLNELRELEDLGINLNELKRAGRKNYHPNIEIKHKD